MTTKNETSALCFALFADLHYKKDVYLSSVADLEAILARADEAGAAFAMHLGDFSNDYAHSPELMRAYLQNPYDLPVYGIYGNHELEWEGNSMDVVTPLLNNRDVVWGTADGRMGDGSIGYYYADKGVFRLISLDTNHAQSTETGEWRHYPPMSEGSVPNSRYHHSVDPVQLAWLKKVLSDAADQGLHCLIFSHAGFSDEWSASPSAGQVRALLEEANASRPGTVLMACNGHLHSNHVLQKNGIVYFDVHTVRNTLWVPNDHAHDHYGDTTFSCVDYDAEGNAISQKDRAIASLWQAKNTWFSDRPLSAIVTVSTDGAITIEGMDARWIHDIIPPFPLADAMQPSITSVQFAAP